MTYTAATDPNTPVTQLLAFLRSRNLKLRYAAISNPSIPQEELSMLGPAALNGRDWYLALCIAQNTNTPEALLLQLSRHLYKGAREKIALNPSTPIEAIAELQRDPELSVQSAALRRPLIQPEELILRSYQAPLPTLRYLAESSVSTLELLTHLAEHIDEELLSSIVKHQNIDSALLQKIAEREELASFERPMSQIAAHPKANRATLEQLSRSPIPETRRAVAKSLALSPTCLTALSLDQEYTVRWSVAANTSTPEEALQRLSRDTHWGVRWQIAQNPKTPAATLSALLSDTSTEVTQAAAANLKTNHT